MNPTDADLIQSYLGGNEESLKTLISRYLKTVYNFAYRLSGNAEDAHDITQETFVKVWKHLKRYDRKKKFTTWLLTITRNTTVDWLRKKRPTVFSAFNTEEDDIGFEHSIPDTEPLQDEFLAQREESETERLAVGKALEKLPLNYKTIVLLHHANDLTFQEIAEVVGKPMNTVKSQYRRALIILKKELHQIINH